MGVYHSFLKGLQLVAAAHAELAIFSQPRATSARAFHGLDNHLVIVVHIHTPLVRTPSSGSYGSTIFHFSKLAASVNGEYVQEFTALRKPGHSCITQSSMSVDFLGKKRNDDE